MLVTRHPSTLSTKCNALRYCGLKVRRCLRCLSRVLSALSSTSRLPALSTCLMLCSVLFAGLALSRNIQAILVFHIFWCNLLGRRVWCFVVASASPFQSGGPRPGSACLKQVPCARWQPLCPMWRYHSSCFGPCTRCGLELSSRCFPKVAPVNCPFVSV